MYTLHVYLSQGLRLYTNMHGTATHPPCVPMCLCVCVYLPWRPWTWSTASWPMHRPQCPSSYQCRETSSFRAAPHDSGHSAPGHQLICNHDEYDDCHTTSRREKKKIAILCLSVRADTLGEGRTGRHTHATLLNFASQIVHTSTDYIQPIHKWTRSDRHRERGRQGERGVYLHHPLLAVSCSLAKRGSILAAYSFVHWCRLERCDSQSLQSGRTFDEISVETLCGITKLVVSTQPVLRGPPCLIALDVKWGDYFLECI